jgi:AcrR family transcriptional regulator
VNREAVAAEALAMLDEEGVDALSMRRLAERLGVGTMTLYGYVRSKDELLDAAVGAAVAEFAFTPPDGPLRDRLRALAHAVRDVFERHPALPQLRARGPVVQPPMFRMTEPGMQMLLDAGFPPEDAARTFRLLFVYVFGAMLFGPDTPSAEEQRRARAALHLLPEDEFPAIAATASHMAASTGGREQFDYALDVILDGIEARARGYSAASSHQ